MLKTYTWLILEEYISDRHIGEGKYEGDCVYVLGHDPKNKRIFCYTGHAFSYTKRIQVEFPTVIEGKSSIYYDEILNEMTEVQGYDKPNISIKEYQKQYIKYLMDNEPQSNAFKKGK